MQIWPAIDLRDGKCVRLQQGDYRRETVFGDDPAATARQWQDQGARRLHLVDLDGARAGHIINGAALAAILAAIEIPCELGGGIRDEATIAHWLGRGISRLVVGTQALKEPQWFRRMCRQFPGRLVLGLDARDGLVATDGWLETSGTPAVDLARQFAAEPLAAVVYTDIAVDGMLTGPNIAAIEAMCAAVELPIVASGGVARRSDVEKLAATPAVGCIIGRALYDGSLSLAEALEAAGEMQDSQARG